MATVRKRKLPSGLIRWQASYVDGAGKRRAKLFEKKSDADGWLVGTRHDLSRGLHTPASTSPTVNDAGEAWLKRAREKGLEAATLKGYEQHLYLHIAPLIGGKKLADMTVPAVHAFADKLREEGRSGEMVRRAIRSLGGIFKDARRRGQAATDPTHGIDLQLPDRDDPRPVIPTKAELQALIANATGKWRPLVLVAIFCGLRASELRGLRWQDVDLETREISLAQRADVYHNIGRMKSRAAYRTIPMPAIVVNSLREWSLACPKGELGLVFPTSTGKVESYSNMVSRGFQPLQVRAGVADTKPVLNDAGEPELDAAGQPKIEAVARYGLHAMRHACASLWIEQGLNAKRIQTLMGHSSIQVTFDRYGHLFKDSDADQRAAQDIQARLMGS